MDIQKVSIQLDSDKFEDYTFGRIELEVYSTDTDLQMKDILSFTLRGQEVFKYITVKDLNTLTNLVNGLVKNYKYKHG